MIILRIIKQNLNCVWGIFLHRSLSRNFFDKLAKFYLYHLNCIFPKKNNLWLIGAWFGERYSDNPKYLFEYILTNVPKIKIVWVTKSKSVYWQLRSKHMPVVYSASLKAIWLLLRAKVYIFSSGIKDVTWFGASQYTIRLQVWHGSPLKKIVCDNPMEWEHLNSENYYRHIRLYPYDKECYSAVVAPSKYYQKIFRSAFRLQSKHFPILGSPRLDRLLSEIKPYNYSAPTLLYAPTFRGVKGTIQALNTMTMPQPEQLKLLDMLLERYQAHMSVQYHPVDNMTPSFDGLNRITQVGFLEDFYGFLQGVDILITDYSGLMFDFLLTKKPVICVISDIDVYITEDRQLYRHPSEIPGLHVCHTWDEASKLLAEILQHGPKPDKILTLEEWCDLYAFQDCFASKRIVKYLKRAVLTK